ncbi:MAG: hypothetical protein WBM40_22890 [Thiohalocapsa sp.]
MSISLPAASDLVAPDRIRRVVDAWVAEQAGTLDEPSRVSLEQDHPDWRAQATRLIAEGLLAYVAVEMVAPDLAIANSNGQHGVDDAELAARLGAHMRDFVDYRGELEALGQRPGQSSGHGPDFH